MRPEAFLDKLMDLETHRFRQFQIGRLKGRMRNASCLAEYTETFVLEVILERQGKSANVIRGFLHALSSLRGNHQSAPFLYVFEFSATRRLAFR